VTTDAARATMHASCVAVAGRGLLILGPSGAGKSALALQVMALGGDLVADDRVDLQAEAGLLVARCPPRLRGLIEARGLGILRAAPVAQAPVHLVVDLAREEVARLPPCHHISLLGVELPLALRVSGAHFPGALVQWLRHGREA